MNDQIQLQVTVLSIFPQMFPGPLQYSLAGKGLQENIWSLNNIDIKQFTNDKQRKVDDYPYGGGAGLVMRADILAPALDYCLTKIKPQGIYYPSPRGRLFNQQVATELIAERNILILCGRFEGIDERIIEYYGLQEISLGDFVLSGGEIAALAMLDSCIRLLPGIIGNSESLRDESFSSEGINKGLLEYPIYTRPASWRGLDVPEVLLSGHHAKIKQWRYTQSLKRTLEQRHDLCRNLE